MKKMRVHPDADLFPMMADDELEELVKSIRENGLREPVVTAEIPGETFDLKSKTVKVIVDGRNRLRACELAGVEPTFRQLDDDEDIHEFIFDANARRNLSKGQLAMKLALRWPEGIGPGKSSDSDPAMRPAAGLIGGKKPLNRIQEARRVLAHDHELAVQVLHGRNGSGESLSLDAALDIVKESESAVAKADDDIRRLSRLRKEAPDLAELVDAGNLKLRVAMSELSDRHEEAKRTAAAFGTVVFESASKMSSLFGTDSPQSIVDHMRRFRSMVGHVSAEDLRRASDGLQQIASKWEESDE